MSRKPEEWELVYVAPGRVEAELVRALLTAAGLAVMLEGEAVGQLYGLHVGPLAQVRVLVPRDKVTEARGLLDARPELDED